MEDKCFCCGLELKPVSELDISTLLEIEAEYREDYPNTWGTLRENRVWVCNACADEIDAVESPEQYEIRMMLEDE